jgi:hypothetical protein
MNNVDTTTVRERERMRDLYKRGGEIASGNHPGLKRHRSHDGTGAHISMMSAGHTVWTHNPDFAGDRPPSPSKENETPGTGDLEGEAGSARRPRRSVSCQGIGGAILNGLLFIGIGRSTATPD